MSSNSKQQQQAIADYLEALLEDVSDETVVSPVVILKDAQPKTLEIGRAHV